MICEWSEGSTRSRVCRKVEMKGVKEIQTNLEHLTHVWSAGALARSRDLQTVDRQIESLVCRSKSDTFNEHLVSEEADYALRCRK